MNRCLKCNNELPADASFCNICGTSQEKAASAILPRRAVRPDHNFPSTANERQGDSQREGSLIAPRRWSNDNVQARNNSEGAPSAPAPHDAPRAVKPPIIPKTTTEFKSLPPGAAPKQLPAPTEGNGSKPQMVSPRIPIPARAPGIIRPVMPPAIQRPSTAPAQTGVPVTPPVPPDAPDTPLAAPEPPVTPRASVSPASDPFAKNRELFDEPFSPLQANSAAQPGSFTSFSERPTNYLHLDVEDEKRESEKGQIPDLISPESFTFTRQAAEHWRKSWRDRQYAEAGPADNVSRGQAAVPAPLLAMQHSFIRMRAIISKQRQASNSNSFGFWVTLFLIVCLIGGVGAYIIYTYLPNAPYNAARLSQPGTATQPSLTIIGTSSTTFTIGQTLRLHGVHFGANDQISFLLDTTIPVSNASGGTLVVQSNAQGAFDASISIGQDWPTGARIIQAVDSRANTSAYIDVQINPTGPLETTSPNLRITLGGQPIQKLTFTAQVGSKAPPEQRITILNTSGAPLQWSAAVSASHGLNWLLIEDNDIGGQLDISQPHSIGIDVDPTGLKKTAPTMPYTGQIIFTLNGNELLTFPVQLTITDAIPEMVFSPQPIVVTAKPDGTCPAGITLTLINLGTEVIHWTVTPDSNIQNNIQFFNPQTGKEAGQGGNLQPADADGDTQVLNLRCSGIQPGHQYHVSIYGNQNSWSELVIVH